MLLKSKDLKYSTLSIEFKKQTSIAEKQYPRLNKDNKFDEGDYLAK